MSLNARQCMAFWVNHHRSLVAVHTEPGYMREADTNDLWDFCCSHHFQVKHCCTMLCFNQELFMGFDLLLDLSFPAGFLYAVCLLRASSLLSTASLLL